MLTKKLLIFKIINLEFHPSSSKIAPLTGCSKTMSEKVINEVRELGIPNEPTFRQIQEDKIPVHLNLQLRMAKQYLVKNELTLVKSEGLVNLYNKMGYYISIAKTLEEFNTTRYYAQKAITEVRKRGLKSEAEYKRYLKADIATKMQEAIEHRLG